MTATPEKITNPLQGITTELYKQGKLEPAYGYLDHLHQCQATEIAELKAQLAEAYATCEVGCIGSA